jgi:hypothetical protein
MQIICKKVECWYLIVIMLLRCQVLLPLHRLFGILQYEMGHQHTVRWSPGFLSIFIQCMNFHHHSPSKECVKFTTVEMVS